MCRAGVGTLSAYEMTTGRVSHQQISPIKGQIVIYRPSIGPDSLRDALRATLVGNHRESSGESRSKGGCGMVEWKLGLIVSALFALSYSSSALAGSVRNGLPCTGSSQCISGYCSDRLPNGKVAGEYLCMSRSLNCPIPGADGVKFYGEYNFGGSHWYCAPRRGILHDGPARPPVFKFGGKCSGFWEKIDCNGDWFPVVSSVIGTACWAAEEPVSRSFCAAADFTKKQYLRQKRR